MNREQMVEKALDALRWEHAGGSQFEVRFGETDAELRRAAADVVDALLPQVSTVEELQALPHLSRLIGADGAIVTRHRWSVHVDCFRFVGGSTAKRALEEFGPLTVVWRPES